MNVMINKVQIVSMVINKVQIFCECDDKQGTDIV